tara:strand:- start:62 stop:1306 length:1245 start_codon:yes stop_codon:yes gene_type:complete
MNLIFKKLVKLDKKYSKKGKLNSDKLAKDYLKNLQNKPKALTQVGHILNLLGERKKSREFYLKALRLDPSNADVHNKIGISYRVEDKLNKAKFHFKNSILANPKNADVFHNLGNIYRTKKKYSEAIRYFQKALECHKKKPQNNFLTRPAMSISKILECIYFDKGKKEYVKNLKRFIKIYGEDIRIATMSSYVSDREKIKNLHPFCKNPINYIYKCNLKKILKNKNISKKDILDICYKVKTIWEPSSRVTRGGFQAIDNIFDTKNYEITNLNKTIKNEVSNFFKKFKYKKDLVVKNKPKKYKIRAWFVQLMSQGFQKSHIHPTAWLSGVFYLNVPKNLKKNQGALKLAQYGYDYPKKKGMKEFFFKPKNYDLIIFPSSLFHSTIPFVSNESRCVIAFDVIPNKEVSQYFKEQTYF